MKDNVSYSLFKWIPLLDYLLDFALLLGNKHIFFLSSLSYLRDGFIILSHSQSLKLLFFFLNVIINWRLTLLKGESVVNAKTQLTSFTHY